MGAPWGMPRMPRVCPVHAAHARSPWLGRHLQLGGRPVSPRKRHRLPQRARQLEAVPYRVLGPVSQAAGQGHRQPRAAAQLEHKAPLTGQPCRRLAEAARSRPPCRRVSQLAPARGIVPVDDLVDRVPLHRAVGLQPGAATAAAVCAAIQAEPGVGGCTKPVAHDEPAERWCSCRPGCFGSGKRRGLRSCARFAGDRQVEEERVGNGGAVEGERRSQALVIRLALAVGQKEAADAGLHFGRY